MRFFSNVRLIVILSALVALSGCAEDRGLVKIAGTVICDGGEPPIAGSITFMPEPGQNETLQATARFGKDGKFVVSTWDEGDGMRPGKYKVRIECWETAPSFFGSQGVSLIDRKYLDWGNNSSMPRLEVIAGQAKVDVVFEVSAATEAVIKAERVAHKAVEAQAPPGMK